MLYENDNNNTCYSRKDMKKEFIIGQKVKRIKPLSDYTCGRAGIIVDIGLRRIRVKWIYNPDGSYITTCGAKPGNGVRTWINPDNIEIIN
jgi:hypothetical protein